MLPLAYWTLGMLVLNHYAETFNVTQLVKEYTNLRILSGCDAKLCSDAVELNNSIGTVCCTNCSCEASCVRNGDCCPEMLQTFPHPDQYPTGGVYGCQSQYYKATRNYVMTVSKCDLKYYDINNIQRCTLNADHHETVSKNMELYIPVVDTRTNETFRNYFCAICNFVPDDYIVQWQVRIECVEHNVFIPRDVSTIIKDIDAAEKCDMLFHPPTGFPRPHTCSRLIDSCNETGKWLAYDELLYNACPSFRAPFDRTYANIFCYLCNTGFGTVSNTTCSQGHIVKSVRWTPSFSLLLDFRKSRKDTISMTESSCLEGFIYDYYKETCREVTCPDRTLYNNGTCHSLFVESPDQMCYEIFIKVSPVGRRISPTSADFQFAIVDFAKKILEKNNTLVSYDIHANFDRGPNINGTVENVYYVLHVEFTGKTGLYFINDLIQLDNTEATVPVHAWYEDVSVLLEVTTYQVLWEFAPGYTSHIIRQNSTEERAALPLVTSPMVRVPIMCLTDHIRITKISACPMVYLNMSEFVLQKRRTGLYMPDLDFLFRLGSFKYINREQLAVCLSDYIPRTKLMYGTQKQVTFSAVSDLITLVCTSLSIACLVIVVVTYCLFPVLRTQPGVNNMALSLTLLLAQILFLFGANRIDIGVWCSVIGGLIHFFLLAVIFWMGVCCTHMFRVFRSIFSQKQIGSIFTTTTVYCLTVAVLSTVGVAINVVVANIQGSPSDYGYGGAGAMCYISSPAMIGYTVTLPAAMVVIYNMFMFLCVVLKINKMPTIQSSITQSRRYISVYVRLSTITGISWLSILPYYSTNIKVFEYMSIVLTSCQGVFILVAFIVNARVLNLHKGIIGMEPTVSHSSSRLRATGETGTRV